jgi:hypothetical protein
MNKLLAAVLAGALAVGILYWRSSRWSWMSTDDGGFQVLMKGPVVGPVSDNEKAPIGKVETKQWHSEPFFGGETFMAMYLDLVGIPPGYDMNAGLKAIANGVAQRSNGSLQGEESIEVSGMPGKQYDVEIIPNGRILLRGFSHDRRIYLLGFKWSNKGEPPPDAAKFFGSFALR